MLIFLQILPVPIILYKFFSGERYDSLTQTLPETLSWYPLSFLPTKTFQYLIQYSGYVFFYMLILRSCAKTKTAQSLALLISLMGLFEALYGLVEHLSGSQSIFGYKNFYPQSSNLTNVATGTFINPNHYGNYLSVCFFITVGLIGFEFSKNKAEGLGWKERTLQFTSESSAKMFFLMGICSTIILAIFFSRSRGATLNLILGVICFTLLSRQYNRISWRPMALGSCILLSSGIFFLWIGEWPFTNKWLNLTKDIYLGESFRFKIWEDALTLFSQFPLFGAGADTFGNVYPLYQSIPDVYIQHAHNDYVQALAEYGLLGFIPMMLCISRVRTYLKVLRVRKRHPSDYLAFGAFAGCFSSLLHSIFEFNFHIPANIFVLLSAVAISTLPLKSEPKSQESIHLERGRNIHFPRWTQLVIICFCMYCVFFCYRISKAGWYLFKVEQGQGRDDNGGTIELPLQEADILLTRAMRYDKKNTQILYRKALLMQRVPLSKQGLSTKEYLHQFDCYLTLIQRSEPLNYNVHLQLNQLYKKFALYYERFEMKEEVEKFKRKAITELEVARKLAPALSGIQNKKP
ncbi:MAG: O-antigen ligase family protein [Chlamydiae bacterium]|nr:O-antigen ligase family protein [Chlamydiota bacterium]MBI3267311.1 O-antigen ligase family protein [Chlamydiota bacterium]